MKRVRDIVIVWEKMNNKMLHIWYIMVNASIIWLSLAFQWNLIWIYHIKPRDWHLNNSINQDIGTLFILDQFFCIHCPPRPLWVCVCVCACALAGTRGCSSMKFGSMYRLMWSVIPKIWLTAYGNLYGHSCVVSSTPHFHLCRLTSVKYICIT